jgi:PAS domain S-box-containing protein
LIVEDDEATAELEKRVLVRSGLTVRRVSGVNEAIALLQRDPFRVVVLDYQLPDGDPWSVVSAAQAVTPRVPVIVVTAMGNEQVAAEALQHGVAEYLPKTDAFWNQLPSVVERVAKIAEADERVRRSDALFRLIADSATDLIATIDLKGIVRDVSHALTPMLGYEPADVLGQRMFDFIHAEDRERVAEAFSAKQDHTRLTYRQSRKHGGYAWVEATTSLVRNTATGLPQEVVGVIRDVTERKRAEDRFRILLEGSPEAHVITDGEGTIVLVNARSEQLFGYDRSELVGRPIALLFPEHRRGQLSWLRLAGAGPISRAPALSATELSCVRKDGSEFPVEISLNWLETEGESLVSGVVVDLTQRKTIQDQEMLLRLGQELPHFDDVESMVGHVTSKVGSYLGVDGCVFYEIDAARETSTAHLDYAPGRRTLAGTYPIMGFNAAVRKELEAGRPIAVNDAETDPLTAEIYLQRYAALGIRSMMSVPRLRDGVWLAALSVYTIQLLQALAERIWLWMEHVRMLRALRDSEGQYRRLIESTHEGVWEMDTQARTRFVNPRMAEMLGYSVPEMYGLPLETFVDEAGRAAAARSLERRQSGIAESHDFKLKRKDGQFVWVRLESTPLADEAGTYTGSLAMVADVTERKQTEQDQQFLLGLAEVLTVTNDADVARRAASSRLGVHLGVDRCLFSEIDPTNRSAVVRDEWQRQPGAKLLGQHPLTSFGAQLHDLASGRTVTINDTRRDPRSAPEYETILRPFGIEASVSIPMHKEGRWIATLSLISATPRVWTRREIALAHATIERTSLCVERLQSIAMLRDFNRDLEQRVGERTSELQAALREKEVLLKEIHHRVKNNLQVISSMINLQAMHLPDEQARALLAESQGRVQSIALVHEALYQSKDLSSVNLVTYVNSLVKSVFHTQCAPGRPIEAIVDAADVRLPVALAIPCGLIINELVTNALKHGFPNGRGGKIRVLLRRGDDRRVELVVADDGVGMATTPDPAHAKSLGLDLVYTFAEQLEAQIEVKNEHGTEFRLSFRDRDEEP